MVKINVKVRKKANVDMPKQAHEGDAGTDIVIAESVTLPPWGRATVPTGLSMEIPNGFVGLMFPRSGLATKLGVSLSNCVGVIDSGYRGEIGVPLINNNGREVTLKAGERVAQMVFVRYAEPRYVEVEGLADSKRGEDGFGSTGR
jgi:dUTP pyrophosphatase